MIYLTHTDKLINSDISFTSRETVISAVSFIFIHLISHWGLHPLIEQLVWPSFYLIHITLWELLCTRYGYNGMFAQLYSQKNRTIGQTSHSKIFFIELSSASQVY